MSERLHLNQIKNLKTEIDCRTVRIGSYKFEPVEKVLITANGLRIMVPLLEDGNNNNLKIDYKCYVFIFHSF